MQVKIIAGLVKIAQGFLSSLSKVFSLVISVYNKHQGAQVLFLYLGCGLSSIFTVLRGLVDLAFD